MAKITKRRVAISAIGAGAMAAAVTLVTSWEGIYTDPYRDIVGVWTVCIGETKADGTEMRRYTRAECIARLPAKLQKYDDGIRACITRELPDSMRVAFLSAAYNVGVSGFCRSSMARFANAGDFRAACYALLMWNRAGGRVVKGLDNRRHDEVRVCLKDVT